MKTLLPVLLVLTGCAMRAQQSFPGINITPNPAGTAGKINLRTGANVNAMFLQANTLSTAATSNKMIFEGSASTGAESFLFNSLGGARFCSPGSGSWDIGPTTFYGGNGSCGGTLNIKLSTTGTIETNVGIGFYEGTLLSSDGIVVRAPAGAVTSSYTINLPGTGPSVAGQALSWVSGSTYQWATPSSSDPAWTSYTPTVIASSGAVVTTTGLNAAYIQTGKSVKVRVVWTGSISTTSASMAFSTPVNPLSTAGAQTIAVAHSIGADSLSVSGGILPFGLNLITVAKDGVGGLFPAVTSMTVIAEGIYESN